MAKLMRSASGRAPTTWRWKTGTEKARMVSIICTSTPSVCAAASQSLPQSRERARSTRSCWCTGMLSVKSAPLGVGAKRAEKSAISSVERCDLPRSPPRQDEPGETMPICVSETSCRRVRLLLASRGRLLPNCSKPRSPWAPLKVRGPLPPPAVEKTPSSVEAAPLEDDVIMVSSVGSLSSRESGRAARRCPSSWGSWREASSSDSMSTESVSETSTATQKAYMEARPRRRRLPSREEEGSSSCERSDVSTTGRTLVSTHPHKLVQLMPPRTSPCSGKKRKAASAATSSAVSGLWSCWPEGGVGSESQSVSQRANDSGLRRA
mmetsp:Transcript_48249/g.103042  ORF Transcript_48249/g.103042 Transcript_48249/m.103042 type:complete len:322 (-) Transcript_48249:351-1316(-)